MQMPARNYNPGSGYRFGFNGMEKDDEVSGNGNSYTTFFRGYDSRLGRWKSIDPKASKFPGMSPYLGMNGNPMFFIDPLGDEFTPSVNKEENSIDYTPEKGDNFQTFTEQYNVTDEVAAEIFKDAGLNEYLPQTETVERKGFFNRLFNGKTKEVTTYKSFGDDAESFSLNSADPLQLQSGSDQAVIDQFFTGIEFEKLQGNNTLEIGTYFSTTGIDGSTHREASGTALINANSVEISSLVIPKTNHVISLSPYDGGFKQFELLDGSFKNTFRFAEFLDGKSGTYPRVSFTTPSLKGADVLSDFLNR